MLDEKIVNIAEKLARELHEGQERKTGGPYIQHPQRVAETLKNKGPCVRAAAWLHDVLEDCGVSKEQLIERLMNEGVEEPSARLIVHFVVEVTDIYTYKQFPKLNREQRRGLERTREANNSPEAQNIRLADIIDNCTDLHKLGGFGKTMGRECKEAIPFLKKADEELRAQAYEVLKSIQTAQPQILILKIQCKTEKSVQNVIDRINKLSYHKNGASYIEHSLQDITA
jgi:(p)ppGpp synthase/HD superfamily hydrolase